MKKNNHSNKFYFIVVVLSIVMMKVVESITDFPFNYYDSSSLIGNIIHISMFVLIFYAVYFLIQSTGLFQKKDSEQFS